MEDLLGVLPLWVAGFGIFNLVIQQLIVNAQYMYFTSFISQTLRLNPNLLEKQDILIGQFIGALIQLGLSIWASVNLLLSSPAQSTWHLETALIGFYTYDLIYLLSFAKGQTMYLFHAHHIGSIILISHLQLHPHINMPDSVNMTIFILELSAASINIKNLYRQFQLPFPKRVELINILIYFITRVILFPIILYMELYHFYMKEILFTLPGIIPSVLLATLYLICVKWCWDMVRRYQISHIDSEVD